MSQPGTHIVAAVMVAFMEDRPFWKGNEKQLYDELTRFKDDPMNETRIIHAMAKLEKVRRKLVNK